MVTVFQVQLTMSFWVKCVSSLFLGEIVGDIPYLVKNASLDHLNNVNADDDHEGAEYL